jgi:D-threo-aldose 1-dehydrogenase
MSIKAKLLSGPLGLGTAPLGNMFRNIPDNEAAATVDAAWQQGRNTVRGVRATSSLIKGD